MWILPTREPRFTKCEHSTSLLPLVTQAEHRRRFGGLVDGLAALNRRDPA